MHYLIPENGHLYVRLKFSMNLLTIPWGNPLKDRLVSALSVRDISSDVDARLHAANHVLVHVDIQHRHQRSHDSHPWGDENDDDDIYIMMQCVFVTKNDHFLLGVSCNHLNHP